MTGGRQQTPERLRALAELARSIEARQEELARAIVATAGKALAVATADVSLAAARLSGFADVARLLAGRAPVGTVAVVFPSNAALSNPAATLGTAFLAGNRVVARFPGASRRWAELAEPLFTAHLEGVTFDRGAGRSFLERVITDPEIAVVMVFGDDSWAAGYEPLVRRHRKKLIFEGPGNDPFLVLPGADIERAAADAVRGSCHDAGQACTSPERFYVHRDLAGEFTEIVVDLARQVPVGPPDDPATAVGPIVSRRVVERIDAQLRDARARGARVLVGGEIREARLADGTPAAYVPPTVLTGVDGEMAVMTEETFGPLVPIQEVGDTESAVALAAKSRYGLTASLFGGGPEEAEALAASHGRVYREESWLDFHRRNLHAPYGGRKRSGWVWEWHEGRFRHREGLRTNALEFSRPTARA